MMDGLVVLCICGLFVTYECCKGKHTFLLLHTILILLSCKACDISKHHLYWKHDMQVILTIVMHTVAVCHGHHLGCNMFLLQLVWLIWLLCCYCLHCVKPILYWQQMYVPCCEDNFSWQKIMVLILQYFLHHFEFLFENEVKCTSNKFYWLFIDWIKWNVNVSWQSRQTNTCLLSLHCCCCFLSICHHSLTMPIAIKSHMKPWWVLMHMMIQYFCDTYVWLHNHLLVREYTCQ